MRHAGPAALDQLEPILAEFRKMAELKEKKRGIFYRGAKAFLHFHEDPAGMFADLKTGADYQRFRANTRTEIAALLRAARKTLAA